MEWWNTVVSAQSVVTLETMLEDWGALGFLALFAFEMLRQAVKRRMSWNLAGDSLASFLTFGFFIVVTYGLIAAAYVSIFYWAYLNFALFEIPVTPWSVALLVVLCDFAYYWEHRFTHRVGLAWATHSVHHSSPYFNISVAYRFGPMDGVWPVFFHLPLAFLGFDPLVIFACEAFVQLYQTVLHTQLIGKLPRPIEWLMNTPSHHRVHHGTNPAYIDKNYGGIFIIWDRLFGSFAEEKEAVTFGLTEQIESVNPLTVYFHGFTRLMRRMLKASSYREAAYAVVAPPEWQPGQARGGAQTLLLPATLGLVLAVGLLGNRGNADNITLESVLETPVTEDEGIAVDKTSLAAIANDYYRFSLEGDEASAYRRFREDAYLHYKMDFGGFYGSTEFGFRANDEGSMEDDLFEGYESLDASWEIADIHPHATGGTVEVTLTEQYRWEGYTGEMTATETLVIERDTDGLWVSRFSSDQVYR